MKKYKSNSELGFNDVSDLIFNAILDIEDMKKFNRKINNNDDNKSFDNETNPI